MKTIALITALFISVVSSGCTRNLWIGAMRNDAYDRRNNPECKLLITTNDSRIAIIDKDDTYISDIIINGLNPSMPLSVIKNASVYGNVDNGTKLSFQIRFDVKTVDSLKIIPVKYEGHYIDCGTDSVYTGSCRLDRSNSEGLIEIGKIYAIFDIWRNRSAINKALRVTGAIAVTPVTVAADVVIFVVAVPLLAAGVPLGVPWPSDAH